MCKREICNPFVLISKRSWSDYVASLVCTTRLTYYCNDQKAISILLSCRLAYFSSSRSMAGSRNVHICRNEKKGRWVKSWILTWISALIRGFRCSSNALARALLMCHLISSQRPGGSCCFGICRQMSFLKYEKLHLLSKESHQNCLSINNIDRIVKEILLIIDDKSHLIFNQLIDIAKIFFPKWNCINGTPKTHPFLKAAVRILQTLSLTSRRRRSAFDKKWHQQGQGVKLWKSTNSRTHICESSSSAVVRAIKNMNKWW